MTDGAIGTFNLQENTSFAGSGLVIGGTSGAAPTLDFDLWKCRHGYGQDNVSKTVSVLATGGRIVINPLAGDSIITLGNYTLIASGGGFSGSGSNGFTLGSNTIAMDGKTYSLSLANSTASNEVLSVSLLPAAALYWGGALSGAWNTISGNSTNWRTDATGAYEAEQVPGSSTDVTLPEQRSDQSHNHARAELLNQGSHIYWYRHDCRRESGDHWRRQYLPSAGTASLFRRDRSLTPSRPRWHWAADQTWTDNGIALQAAGSISGPFGLTTAGSGTLILGGSNTYSGGTTFSPGRCNWGMLSDWGRPRPSDGEWGNARLARVEPHCGRLERQRRRSLPLILRPSRPRLRQTPA